MTLSNCVECGKVFVKALEKLCPACVKKRETELNILNDWIKKNAAPRLANIEKETGISEKTFMKYLLDGKLKPTGKLIAQCEVCGKDTYLTAKNAVCPNCRASLKKAQTYKKPGELENTELYSKAKDKFKK